MMAYKREIVIFIITALATLSAVYYFFGDMEEGKNVAQTDLYTLTAPSPAAILSVNRPAAFAKLILTKQPVYQAFASEIPEIFLSIVQKNTAIPALQFSFHTQGVVMYAKADKSIVDNIENKILKSSFGAFEPQKQKKGEITFTYFPDAGNRFFGYYQYEGIWVASYSKKLLEEVATMQTNHTNQLQKEQIHLCKSLDRNAPLNLLIRSEKLNLYVKTNDSTQWKIDDRWLGADLFESEGNICYFSNLPYHAPADTLYRTIADTLSLRLEQYFPQLHISSQSYEEDGKVFYTGCTSTTQPS
ncbi:hypothetical protein [Parabacteroides sp. HGS0025]|uniref:hypothetical protein n=1 Tax=Parabacteroides sp. HGS0025 TaxID=1078087 RepID=UPI0006172AAD|nr:hypothetical protein [Parabacteroides sp. HGS0025]